MTHARLITFAAALLVSSLTSCVAFAFKDPKFSFLDGNDLYELCSSKIQLNLADCFGYTSALADVLNSSVSSRKDFCPPEGMTRRQVKDIVTIWLERHPQHRSFNAVSLAAAALEEAFPCNR
jgi:hypothetical protein